MDELGATFERLGVEHERLDADSVAQRFPQVVIRSHIHVMPIR